MKAIPISEIQRNKRVRELMLNKVPRSNAPSLHLTLEEFEQMKEYMKKGYSREQSIKIVRDSNKNNEQNKKY